MKSLVLALLFVALVPGSSLSQDPPELERLLADHFAARGGVEKIHALETLRAHGKRFDGSREFRFTWEWKRPGWVRYEVETPDGVVVQGWDGRTGWLRLPGFETPRILEEEVVRRFDQEADLDGPLVDAEAKRHRLRLLEPSEVDGAPAWVVGVVLPGGDVQHVYLDRSSLLEMRRVTRVIRDVGDLEIIADYGGYREVGGLLLPHRQRVRARGREGETIMFFERVETGIALPDERFHPPSDVTAAN